MKRILLTILSAVVISGCSKSRSTAIDASEVYGSYTISYPGSGSVVTCKADLQVGGSTGSYIELSGSDHIYCSDGTTEVEMDQNSSLIGQVSYEATTLSYDASKTYSIRLLKSGTSYSASTALPTALTISAPTTSTSQQLGTAVAVTWTAATSDSIGMIWTRAGTSSQSSLVESDSYNTNDDGSYTIPATDTTLTGATTNATATLQMTRYGTSTTVGGGLKGGSIQGLQTKSVAFTLTP